MKPRLAMIVAVVAALAATVSPTAASAATEFGSNCAATGGEPELTFFDLSHSSAEPLPTTAPVSGVITQGKTSLNLPFPVGSLTAALQVFRAAGPNQFTLVGQSSPVAVSPGSNTFPTRVPVQAGDHVAFFGHIEGEVVGLFCQTGDPGDVMAYTDQQPSVGGTAQFEQAPGYRAPIAAVIEPDADNDGYGDETQDGCPQSAAVQTACPVVTLDAVGLPGAKSVVVMVATSTAAPVSVSGVVNLGKGKKATLNAGSQTVSPGTLTRFKLKFSSKLTKRLKELEPKKKLTLKITASATNVTGQVSSDTTKAKLKGQA